MMARIGGLNPALRLSLVVLALGTASQAVADMRCVPREACLSIGTCDVKMGGGEFQARHTKDGVDIYPLTNGKIAEGERPDRMQVLTVTDDGTAVLMQNPQGGGPIGFISIYDDGSYVLSLHGVSEARVFGLSSTGKCTGRW